MRNVDLSNKTLYIRETKAGEDREISINDMLYESLRNLEERKNGPYVFPNKEGKPYVDIRKGFKAALRRTGIKNFRFHDLRHTFASHLVMGGIDLKTVQELMGHKSFEMTLRYAHLSLDHKKAAIEKLGVKMQSLVTNRLQEC